jgi:hypothetical protein
MEVRDQRHNQLGGKLSRPQGLSGFFKEEKTCCQRKHNETATRKNHNKHANHQKEPPKNRSVGKIEGKEHGS